MLSWDTLQAIIRTISEILTAGVAITGFSLLIYALSFNLRVRVTRAFALMLLCVVIIFTAESLGGIAGRIEESIFWQHIQWVGVLLLPATYLDFSDSILALTGKPSRWRRVWAVRIAFLISAISLALIPFGVFFGTSSVRAPAVYFETTLATDIFLLYFGVVLVMSCYNLVRAYRRSTTSAGRRRLGYLLVAAVAPAIGAFPFLPYSPSFFFNHPVIFWTLASFSSFIVGGLIIVMAYSVAFFGVPWPDRVVRLRLLKWIMRGPFTASLTLGVVTLVRRSGNALGWNAEIVVPILMTVTILLCQHLITLFSPIAERMLFYGNEREEIEALERLEFQLVTRNDLRQFLEMVLTAVSDLLQATGGYVIDLEAGSSELVVVVGRTRFDDPKNDVELSDEVLRSLQPGVEGRRSFHWQGDTLFALNTGPSEQRELIGLLGVANPGRTQLDRDQMRSLELLEQRAAQALADRRVQRQILNSLGNLSPQVTLLQRLRAAGRFDREGVLANEDSLEGEETILIWVKEALTHYWGGPRLTGSPLMRYRIVQEAMQEYDGNQANALRAILRRAIEQIRPEGERRFTAEWILYNILDMKFVEGKKVREIAMRLAMSEADLYRKQRVAIEAVARAIEEMENQAARQGTNFTK